MIVTHYDWQIASYRPESRKSLLLLQFSLGSSESFNTVITVSHGWPDSQHTLMFRFTKYWPSTPPNGRSVITKLSTNLSGHFVHLIQCVNIHSVFQLRPSVIFFQFWKTKYLQKQNYWNNQNSKDICPYTNLCFLTTETYSMTMKPYRSNCSCSPNV